MRRHQNLTVLPYACDDVSIVVSHQLQEVDRCIVPYILLARIVLRNLGQRSGEHCDSASVLEAASVGKLVSMACGDLAEACCMPKVVDVNKFQVASGSVARL